MRREPGQRFSLVTQGCKVNQYETQAIREAWLAEGLLETKTVEQADIVVINSCAVTERAILDLGKLTRPLAALAPKPWIVVVGCAVEADRDRVAALPGVDEVISQKDKPLLRRLDSNTPQPAKSRFPALDITNYNRARAVLKVQDGCSHGCTYCIIPKTRGASVSRDPAEVVAEAKRLLDSGIRELALCGINLRHYGRDLHPRRDFWDLVSAVDAALAPEWAGRARLRLGSLEPADLKTKALDTLGASRLMSPHLHISLQSGSPTVLRRMGRGHYGPRDILDFTTKLRAIWPVFGLGADLITGFPGETEALFSETLDVADHLPLSYAHVFPYSERPGTPAATFPDVVPSHVRRDRAKRLRAVVAEKRDAFLRALLGHDMTVIPEDNRHGMNEFYVECQADAPGMPPSRQFFRVRAMAVAGTGLLVRTDPSIQRIPEES